MKKLEIKDDTGKLFYVGGVVRDELLKRESFDVDVVFEGDAIEHCSHFGEVVRVNPDFGTVRVEIGEEEVDFASTRSESYPKAGHLPVVEKIGCSLKEDVMRRDFTINAMAKSFKTGEIIDYVGGLADLKSGVLRVLHGKSFIDDPTRIIRALKFSVRFGFRLEENSRRLQEEYLKNINYDMCYKRIKKELIETFNLNSQEAFERFYDEGIYKLVSPVEQVRPNMNVPVIVKMLGVIAPWIVYVGALDLSNLELSRVEAKIIEDFENLRNLSLKTDFEIYRAFEKLLPETLALYAVWVEAAPVLHYLTIKNVKICVTGDDLVALGIKPSPKYGEIFDAILKAKLANPRMTKEEELAVARGLDPGATAGGQAGFLY